jgi:hypothetical protein
MQYSFGSILMLLIIIGAGYYWFYLRIPPPPVVTVNGHTYYEWSPYQVKDDDVQKFESTLPRENLFGQDCGPIAQKDPQIVDWFFDSSKRICVALKQFSYGEKQVEQIIDLRNGTVFAECDASFADSEGTTVVYKHTCSYGSTTWVEYLDEPTTQPFFYPLGTKNAPTGSSMWEKFRAFAEPPNAILNHRS